MTAFITDTEAIQQIVREVVADVFRRDLPSLVREATQKPYLTKEEVMALTGWSDRKLQNLRSTRQLPFRKNGHKIVYSTAEIYEFLDAHKVDRRTR